MKNPLLNPLFLVAIAIYAGLLILKKTGIYVQYLSDYAADFLTMPVVLSIALFVLRKSASDRNQFSFSPGHILFAVTFYSFLFEWLFPYLSNRFTADPFDILAYAFGALFFSTWMNES